LKDHVIVCGYGTKGRAAVSALLETGYDKSQIVIVESRDEACGRPGERLVAIEGNVHASAVLLQADVKNGKSVIIATDSDEASVLITSPCGS
jgi:voltage-gated potassium channel